MATATHKLAPLWAKSASGEMLRGVVFLRQRQERRYRKEVKTLLRDATDSGEDPQITLSVRSAAISVAEKPSSLRISSVCSPVSGECVRTEPGVRESVTGGACT
jgi:hypothetical protein